MVKTTDTPSGSQHFSWLLRLMSPAALEVLSATAEVGGLLTEDELEIAYGYSVKVMEYMVDFWYDKDMESINMWEHGGSLEPGSGPTGNRDRNHLDHPVSGLRKRRIES